MSEKTLFAFKSTSAQDEKLKEVKLFYQLNDEIKRETDSFNFFSKQM